MKLYLMIGGASLLAGLVFGFVLGRDLRWEPASKPVTVAVVTLPDAGPMPVAMASADAGSSTATAEIHVTVRSRRSVHPQGVPSWDAGSQDQPTATCPECPTLEVTAKASGNGAPCGASSEAVPPTPLTVTVHDLANFKHWGFGVAGSYGASKFGLGGTFTYQPVEDLEFNLTFTSALQGSLTAQYRFGR
jgi:hypothetical protein